jgi:hypothetical protein
MLVGEATIIACALFTNVAFLWYNVIGAVVVIVSGLIFSMAQAGDPPKLTMMSSGGMQAD